MSSKTVSYVLAAACAAAWPSITRADHPKQIGPSQTVVETLNAATVIKGEVRPFSIGEVRLLPGPFKRAERKGREYLLSLDPDRLLAPFYETAGLKPKKTRYKGWESTDLAGHTLGHWLTAASRMAVLTDDGVLRRRVDRVVSELAVLQTRDEGGYLGGFPKSYFEDIFKGSFKVEEANLAGHWVPWYTFHKILAGLIDAHRIGGNAQALTVAMRLADWAKTGTDRLADQEFQRMLDCEFGGMNESLAELYALTGEKRYLALAERFTHRKVLDPLARSKDPLTGLHANTQIPKLVGAARLYELTGKPYFRRAASFFWDRVVSKRSYVFGGNSKEEHFSPLGKEPLGRKTAETCNTHNMLRLTKTMMAWDPESRLADYYESALYNQILASLDPETGMMLYFLSTKPGHFKVYSTPFDSMWCCTGTGMENTARFAEAAYFHDEKDLWVSLYLSSEVRWKDKGLLLRQETAFPEEPRTKLTVQRAPKTPLGIRLRVPKWADGPVVATVNGEEAGRSIARTGWIRLERIWKPGDVVALTLPMGLRLHRAADDPQKVAVIYGPVVLAGEMGRKGYPLSDQAVNPDGIAGSPYPTAPTLVTEGDPLEGIQRVQGRTLAFESKGIGKPDEIRLVPLYQLHHQRYSVYLRLRTPRQWMADEKTILESGSDLWPEAPLSPKPKGDLYEAEAMLLEGGAVVASDHDGFSGAGFVAGYYQGTGQRTTFRLMSHKTGKRSVVVRYANGMTGTQNLSLYVNGVFNRKARFKSLGDWERWDDLTLAVDLVKGENTIALQKDPGDGCVNLDCLAVQ